ncbi:hypothetical protein ZWY2020_013135 [Hordeum vulgare]|nr:hypothetical protein ZWY2020_013135 [Hordeum vulgare]
MAGRERRHVQVLDNYPEGTTALRELIQNATTPGPRGCASTSTAAPPVPNRFTPRRLCSGRAPPFSPTTTPPSPTMTSPAYPASAAARRPPRHGRPSASVLKLMRMLGQGDAYCSDYMNDILAQVATKTESNKNAGNAILYEGVETIMGIEATSGLRVLAINILGRFLSNRDNNIRYVALNILMRAITVDTQALQRHMVTILECVKDADASIRKRALELVYLLVSDTNVKPLTKELVDYLQVADPDFKEDLTAKICSIAEKLVTTSIYNLILGKLYCDHYGTMRIQGNREYSCKLKFKEQSIIDRNPHQVQGVIQDRSGRTIATLFGKWDESMHYVTGDCFGKGKGSQNFSQAHLL